MTSDAEKHLVKAERLLAKGDGFYAQAADEIIAAQQADPTLSNREIGERFGRSRQWVRILVAWRTSGTSSLPTPYAGEADAINVRKTKQILREAPLEQVEQIVASLPKERQTAILAAAGGGYEKARQAENERVKNLTPAQKKEIEAAQGEITAPFHRALGPMTAQRVVNHIDQATDGVKELISNNALTKEAYTEIQEALTRFHTELDVALAMAGLEGEEIA